MTVSSEKLEPMKLCEVAIMVTNVVCANTPFLSVTVTSPENRFVDTSETDAKVFVTVIVEDVSIHVLTLDADRIADQY